MGLVLVRLEKDGCGLQCRGDYITATVMSLFWGGAHLNYRLDGF